MLFYRAALSLSRKTLTFVARIIRRHRVSIGSCWPKLNSGRRSSKLAPTSPDLDAQDARSVRVYTGPTPAQSGVVSCLPMAQRTAFRGSVPPTNCQRMIKGLTVVPDDQAPDLHFLVAGAGFEPATSGL
jgi:hypothetical protein